MREYERSLHSTFTAVVHSVVEETTCLLAGDGKSEQGFRTRFVSASVSSYICWSDMLNSSIKL